MEWKITDTKNLSSYSEKIFEMYENSYREIGLIDFGGWEGLQNYLNCSCYLLIDKDTKQELNGIILYWLSEYGNKISLVISSTQEIGKTYVIPKLIELLRIPGFYAELSDALEYLVRKNGIDNIKDKEVIKNLIPGITNEDIFNEGDDRCILHPLNKKNNTPSPSGSYIRNIKDIGMHRKALYGLPCLNKVFDNDTCNRKCLSRGGKTQKKTKHKKRENTKKYKIPKKSSKSRRLKCKKM
jgi:hypothetical protein